MSKPNSNVLNDTIKNDIINTVKGICTPTGDLELDKARGKHYAKSVGMDAPNAKMLEVMTTQGPSVGAKAMMEDCGGDYAAMRARYG